MLQDNAKYAAYENPISTRRLAATRVISRVQSLQPHAPDIGDTAQVGILRQNGNLETYTIPWQKTGTPLEVGDPADLIGRPGAALVDFDRGRVRPRTVFDLTLSQLVRRGDHVETSVRLALLNLTDHAYALNFGNPFSGTHFGAPRTIRVELHIGLR